MTEEKAIFAGGCFWCMVKPFDQMPGIKKVVSGYTGGHVPNPTYEEVCSGTTGHTEAVEITFDPAVISYEQLVAIYWQQTDPTDAFGQFADRGDSYRPVIFMLHLNKKKRQRHLRHDFRQVGASVHRLLQQSNQYSPFIQPKSIIKIFTKKILSIMLPIAKALVDAASFVKIGKRNGFSKAKLRAR